jgi:hypothetical protein
MTLREDPVTLRGVFHPPGVALNGHVRLTGRHFSRVRACDRHVSPGGSRLILDRLLALGSASPSAPSCRGTAPSMRVSHVYDEHHSIT